MQRLNRYRLTRPRKKTADGWEGDIGGKREARDSDSASGRSFPGPVFPEPSSLSQRGCCVHLFLLLLFFPPHSQRRFGRRAWIPGPLPRHPAANLHLRRSRRKITECALFLPRESGSCPPDLGVEPPSIRGSACVFVSLANHFFFFPFATSTAPSGMRRRLACGFTLGPRLRSTWLVGGGHRAERCLPPVQTRAKRRL